MSETIPAEGDDLDPLFDEAARPQEAHPDQARVPDDEDAAGDADDEQDVVPEAD